MLWSDISPTLAVISFLQIEREIRNVCPHNDYLSMNTRSCLFISTLSNFWHFSLPHVPLYERAPCRFSQKGTLYLIFAFPPALLLVSFQPCFRSTSHGSKKINVKPKKLLICQGFALFSFVGLLPVWCILDIGQLVKHTRLQTRNDHVLQCLSFLVCM